MTEELQMTIDALNARTAAYDVQIIELNQQIARLNCDIAAEKEASAAEKEASAAEKEASAAALQAAEEKRASDTARLTAEINEKQTALTKLSEALGEAVSTKQVEIAELRRQAAEANAAALENEAKLQAEILKLQAERDQYQNDNQALRTSLSNYLMSTDDGKAALREFNVMLLKTQAEAIRQQLAELEVI